MLFISGNGQSITLKNTLKDGKRVFEMEIEPDSHPFFRTSCKETTLELQVGADVNEAFFRFLKYQG
jgi:ribosomal protein L31